MKFGKSKYFIAGLLVGVMITAAIPVLADNERVVALIDRTIKLEIAGEVKTLPEGYAVLTYDNRTYLPSRYVAEQLGATVKWDETKRWITITEPPAKEVEKIVEVPKEVEKIVYVENTNYQNLPASASKDGVSLIANGIARTGSYPVKNDDGTTTNAGGIIRVSTELRNVSGERIIVDYTGAVLAVDNQSMKVNPPTAGEWNSNPFLAGDIGNDTTISGAFTFPASVGGGTKNFILTVPVTNQGTNTSFALTVRFTATLNED